MLIFLLFTDMRFITILAAEIVSGSAESSPAQGHLAFQHYKKPGIAHLPAIALF